MRRVLVPLFAVPLLAVALVAVAGCGTTADTTAATVGDQAISTDTVDQLTRDAVFVQTVLNGTPPPEDQSVLPGDTARSSLLFEIQRTALMAELDRWGLEVTDQARDQARSSITQQLPQKVEAANLERLTDYVVANGLLEQRLAKLDPESDTDLRTLYDGAPSLWDRVCLAAVQMSGDDIGTAQDALDGGTELEDLQDKVDGSQLVADPAQGCTSRSQLPKELRDDVALADDGQVRGPVVVATARGDVAFFYRVDESKRLAFGDDEAQGDLAQLAQALQQRAAQQQAAALWIGLVLQEGVEVNPRYGAGVSIDAQGQLSIEPPEAPPTTLAPQVPGAGGLEPTGP
jgi:hypothetical protein